MQKVLFYTDEFGGNTTTFIYNEVIGLSQYIKVKYVCTKRFNPDIFPFDDVEIVPYEVNRVVRKLRWWLEIYDVKLIFRNTAFSKRINKIVNEFEPDLIQCHFGYEALRLVDNLDRTDIPIVVTFQGHDASYFLKRKSYVDKLKDLFSRENVYATFVCDFLKRNLEKVGVKFNGEKVIYSGTRLTHFKRRDYDHPKEPFTFLQVSHFEERKGHKYVLEAFKTVLETKPEKKVKLILAGGGPDLEPMKQLAMELGIHEQVDFPGWVSPEQVRELLENAHAYILHSLTVDGWTEGIPNAIMEAMAMELPVISTRHAGIPELVDEGIHGILTDERDTEALATGMLEVLKWGYMSVSREKIIERFEYQKRIDTLMEYYQKITGSQPVLNA